MESGLEIADSVTPTYRTKNSVLIIKKKIRKTRLTLPPSLRPFDNISFFSEAPHHQLLKDIGSSCDSLTSCSSVFHPNSSGLKQPFPSALFFVSSGLEMKGQKKQSDANSE